jgi:hypothetical protein
MIARRWARCSRPREIVADAGVTLAATLAAGSIDE